MADNGLFEKAIALLRQELFFWEHYPGSEGRNKSTNISAAISDLAAGNITEKVLRMLSELGKYYLNLCNFSQNPEQLEKCGLPQKIVDDWVAKREQNSERSLQFFILWQNLLELATSEKK